MDPIRGVAVRGNSTSEHPMRPSISSASHFLTAMLVFVVAGVAGCASAPVGPPVDAPRLAVGDRWQYQVTANLRRGAVSQLDMEVIAISGRSARVRLGLTDNSGRAEWIDEFDGRGGLSVGSLWHEPARPFNPPAQLLAFPLDDGKTWRQSIDTLRADTQLKDQILIYGKVGGRQTTNVPARRVDAGADMRANTSKRPSKEAAGASPQRRQSPHGAESYDRPSLCQMIVVRLA